MSNPIPTFSKRTRIIKNQLKKKHLKMAAIVEVSGKSRVTVSQILNGIRYPKFTDQVLLKIENYLSA